MKQLVFDSGPMISLTLNSLLWVLEPLKERFQGDFIVPPSVKEELVDKPLTTKKYKLEAFQILPYFNRGTLKVVSPEELEGKTKELLNLVDNTFSAKGKFIQLVHHADMQVVALGILTGADAIVIDEYTTRLMIENPRRILKRMEKKLHTKCSINEKNLEQLKAQLKGLRVLRSVELITIAYEAGILDRYLFEGEKRFVKQPKKTLLEAALWSLKLNGCAISEYEIQDVLDIENS
jgi:hypothetical protein